MKKWHHGHSIRMTSPCHLSAECLYHGRDPTPEDAPEAHRNGHEITGNSWENEIWRLLNHDFPMIFQFQWGLIGLKTILRPFCGHFPCQNAAAPLIQWGLEIWSSLSYLDLSRACHRTLGDSSSSWGYPKNAGLFLLGNIHRKKWMTGDTPMT